MATKIALRNIYDVCLEERVRLKNNLRPHSGHLRVSRSAGAPQ